MRIWLIEDHDDCRATLLDELKEIAPDAVVQGFASCGAAVKAVSRPDLIIADATPLDAGFRVIAERHPDARIVVYSSVLVEPFLSGAAKHIRETTGVDRIQVVPLLGRDADAKLRKIIKQPPADGEKKSK